MNLAQLKATLASLLNDVKPLTEKSVNGALTDEENTRFDELVEQIQKCQADIAAAVEREGKAQEMRKLLGEQNQGQPNGRERIEFPNGGRITFHCTSAGSGRGVDVDVAYVDGWNELSEATRADTAAASMFGELIRD